MSTLSKLQDFWYKTNHRSTQLKRQSGCCQANEKVIRELPKVDSILLEKLPTKNTKVYPTPKLLNKISLIIVEISWFCGQMTAYLIKWLISVIFRFSQFESLTLVAGW